MDGKTALGVTAYLMPGAAHNGWEDSSGGVVTGEASFAHSRAIVDYEGGNVVVTHLDCVCNYMKKMDFYLY